MTKRLFLQSYIRGHPGLQQSFLVLDADFDAEYQMVAFVAALHVARREFALSVDLLDHTVERADLESVDLDFGLLADLDHAELRFGDVDANVDLIFFEQPRYGLIRRDEIAGADRQDFDDGVGRRFDFAFGALDFDLFEPGLRLGQFGAGVGYLFGARACDNQPFGLLRLTEPLLRSADVFLAAAVEQKVQTLLFGVPLRARVVKAELRGVGLLLRRIACRIKLAGALE